MKNKHVLMALIITPVLALIGYFTVDYLTAEKPHAAVQGESYRLVEMPNCRYESGECSLQNGDFELNLVVHSRPGQSAVLKLSSAHALDGVKVAVLQSEVDETPPRDMHPDDGDGRAWTLNLDAFEPEQDRLHLAALANESLYFGDAALKFATRSY